MAAIKRQLQHKGYHLRDIHTIVITHCHHEKWDGTGYPEGLGGEAIPISGRIMAIADVYDALICRRIYKPAYSHQEAADIIVEGAGNHFDPDMVDAFSSISSIFNLIAKEFSDDASSEEKETLEPR